MNVSNTSIAELKYCLSGKWKFVVLFSVLVPIGVALILFSRPQFYKSVASFRAPGVSQEEAMILLQGEEMKNLIAQVMPSTGKNQFLSESIRVGDKGLILVEIQDDDPLRAATRANAYAPALEKLLPEFQRTKFIAAIEKMKAAEKIGQMYKMVLSSLAEERIKEMKRNMTPGKPLKLCINIPGGGQLCQENIREVDEIIKLEKTTNSFGSWRNFNGGAMPDATVEVVAKAAPAGRPEGRNRLQSIMLSGLVAFFMAVLWFVIRHEPVAE